MNGGLKSVSVRRNDALSRISWDRLESVMAEYYRADGYEVDHCGTGANARKFDGGIDLKLRRGDDYVLVQCKHWNAYKVTHNDVHQLLGIVMNEGATGGILVNSGEFTKAAIEAAARLGTIRLIDGDELRQMIGPLPDESAPPAIRRDGDVASGATAFAARTAERLVAAAEHRVRHGALPRTAQNAVVGTLTVGLTKLACVGLVLVAFLIFINTLFDNLGKSLMAPHPAPSSSIAPAVPATMAASAPAPTRSPMPAASLSDEASVPVRPTRTKAEQREWERRQAESMRILEANTPEL